MRGAFSIRYSVVCEREHATSPSSSIITALANWRNISKVVYNVKLFFQIADVFSTLISALSLERPGGRGEGHMDPPIGFSDLKF